MIDKIKKYQRFFEKLEKKQRFGNRYMNARNAFAGVPGVSDLFDEIGDVDLTVEDVKLGMKLNLIDKIERFSTGEDKLEAKLNYYKNMKPKTGIWKMS